MQKNTMAINKFTDCLPNCAVFVPPILDVNQDCTSTNSMYLSMITDIVLLSRKDSTGATNALPAALTAVAFAAMIDNTDTTGAKAKRLKVEGAMPAPELVTTQLGFDTVTVYRTYTMTATVKQMTTNNLNALRKYMCGGFDGYIWLFTTDFVLGGITASAASENAIRVQTIDSNITMEGALDSFIKGELVVKFRTKSFPPFAANFGL
jgi:hypothetical protein